MDARDSGFLRGDDLAMQAQTRIVLIGNYGLVRESARGLDWFHRQLIVHFRRYDKRQRDELAVFVSAIEELLGSMPLNDGQRMKKFHLSDTEQIYNRCVGCFGEAKKAFTMAYSHALSTGEQITADFLVRFMLPIKSAKKIAIDALEGEQILLDEDESSLSKILEYRLAKGSEYQASKATGHSAMSVKNAVDRKQLRIGERTPTRDPVGAVYARRA
jgi:hypothetical protein